MDLIQHGEYKPESRLPSVREYAVKTEVNPNTMMRTFTWLQNENLIYMKRGIGYFVTTDAPQRISDMRKKNFFEHEAPYFMQRLAMFGITPEQLADSYKKYLDQTK